MFRGFLRQSTGSQIIWLGPFEDTTGAAVTSLSIANTDIKLRKWGSTSAASKNSGGATHDANGNYYTTLDSTDTNTVGILEIRVTKTGALIEPSTYCILEEAVYDALFPSGATGLLPANVTQLLGTAWLTPTTAGTPDVNVKLYAGQTAAVGTDNLPKVSLWSILGTALTEASTGLIVAAFKKFFDIVTPTSTMNRITLVDTVTTNTDMRGTDGANTTAPDNAGIASAAYSAASAASSAASAASSSAQAVTDIGIVGTAVNAIGVIVTAIQAIFTGMTSLPAWLQWMIRSDAGTGATATALTTAGNEINVNGGTADKTTDNLQGVYDKSVTVELSPEDITAIADQTVAGIQAIPGFTVEVVSPIDATGNITVKQGDSYLDANNRAISVTLTTTQVLDAACTLRVFFGGAKIEYTGTVSGTSPNYTLKFDLTSVQTAAMSAGLYSYEVEVTITSGSAKWTPSSGQFKVTAQIG